MRKITPTRFSLDIPERDAANGIYAAVRAEVAQRGKDLIFDADTRSHIEKAARWMTNPEGKFGLLLMGTPGNGKTSMLYAIARLIAFVTEETNGYSKRQSVNIVTAREITRLCASEDESDRKAYNSLYTEKMLGIDDLGEEPREVMVWGRIEQPLEQLLSSRYAKQQFTIITTNLDKKLLEEKYGVRIYDRFKEMMDIITFTNPSYRK